jgi:hypothetical protein
MGLLYLTRCSSKNKSACRRNQERILFRLVFGTLNAHSYTRCSNSQPCESVHFCARVIVFRYTGLGSQRNGQQRFVAPTFSGLANVWFLSVGILERQSLRIKSSHFTWTGEEHSKRYGDSRSDRFAYSVPAHGSTRTIGTDSQRPSCACSLPETKRNKILPWFRRASGPF